MTDPPTQQQQQQFAVGSQVWVRTGLTGSHEEPATITEIIDDSYFSASEDESESKSKSGNQKNEDGSSSSSSSSSSLASAAADGQEGMSTERQQVTVKYPVSGIEETVGFGRLRSFGADGGGGEDGAGRRGRSSSRKRAQPDRLGSSSGASAVSATAAASSSGTPKPKSSGRGASSRTEVAAPVTPSPAVSPVPTGASASSSSAAASAGDGASSSDELIMVSVAKKKKAVLTAASKKAATKPKVKVRAKRKTRANDDEEDSSGGVLAKVPATPPPTRKRKAALKGDAGTGGADDDEEANSSDDPAPTESPYFSPSQKKKAKTRASAAAASAKAATKKSKAKKGSAKAKAKADDDAAASSTGGTKAATKAKGKRKKSSSGTASVSSSAGASSAGSASASASASAAGGTASSSASRPQAGQPDGNGGLNGNNIPFFAEYAKTGRATCRRCDEKILKGQLRIGHIPLFRGKPGYTVYRHLQCAVFGEHIKTAEDVDGCSDLEEDDYERLKTRVTESVEESKQEQEALEPDELVPVQFKGEIRSVPAGLTANLLPFQVEGSSWMYHQEVKEPEIRGGVMADEMGMGKTLQTIVTVLDNRPKLQHASPGAKHPPGADRGALKAEENLWEKGLEDWKHEMVMNNVPKSIIPKARGKKVGGGAKAGTLVICPVIALTQWKTEIEKFTEHGSLSVCIYHGSDRASDLPRDTLRKYDVVLTTYQVLEADMRKMISPNKVKCPNCGGKFKVDKLRVHLKYFCGEGARRTEAQARTIRNSERGGRGGGNGGGGGGGGGGTKKTKKGDKKSFPDEKKSMAKTKTSSAAKKKKGKSKSTVRVKGGQEYESESDLSIAEEIAMTPSPRTARGSSRSAAKQASKRMKSSASKWMDKGADSDDYFSPSDSDDDDESSSDEEYGKKKPAKRAPKKKAAKAKQPPSDISDDEDSEDSSSDEDIAVKRAVAKQRKALAAAKQGGKAKAGKKKSPPKGKKASAAGKKGGKKKMMMTKKKSFGAGGADPDSSDSDSSDSDRDPMEGIDMDKLMEEAMAGSQMSVLHSLTWWRIVLDEAHFIKSRSSQTANAAFALIGIHRWCLSGTPLQNRVGEFYSLIRFLRLNPMAHYLCRQKDCNCKSLHYRMMNGKCQDCGHGSVQHYSHFNKYVLNPIQRDGYSGDGRRAMFVLKDQVLDKCLLRRTKETKAEDMNLPPRFVNIRPVRLHPVEEDFYNALYTQTKTSFDDYDSSGNLRSNYAHVFDLLMRLRQSVDHPYLVIYSKKNKEGLSPASGPAIANGSADCDICHEPPTDRVVSSCCQAAFCRGCVLEYMSTLGEGGTPCPCCRAPFTIDLNQVQHDVIDDTTLAVDQPAKASTSSIGMPALKELTHVASGSILRRINLAEFATSSKIEALTQDLVMMRQKSPGSKAIVFSQFVNMLDLIRWRLHSDPCLADMGLGARALHGGMDVKSRDAVLKDFREDNNVRVLLMSLKAGGVALNLTVANHLYLMDPWWNPAAEMQAIDRTHRLGQHRPIRAVRFIAENTVEERILQLQEKKRLVFDGTVGRDAASLKMLSVDDMKALFN